MNFETYVNHTRRTWNNQTKEMNRFHYSLGMQSEVGELMSAYKKNLGYGKVLDKVNVLEEIGDYAYFHARCFDEEGINYNPNAFVFKDADDKSDYEILQKLYFATYKLVDSIGDAQTYTERQLHYCQYLICLIGNKIGVNLETIRTSNIAKLNFRMPDKFDADIVLVRNLASERDIIASYLNT